MVMAQDSAVAIYARVSSDKQAKDDTIASQIEQLEHRVRDDGFALDQEMCFIDDGCSGDLARPALERLRDTVASGAVDRLYVLCPDRFARSYAYQVLLVDEFERCGVEVIFLNYKFGETPDENMFLQLQGVIAEYERAKILERSRRGKQYAARHGSVSVLSGAPYGYRYLSCEDGVGHAEYQIVLEQARVVRQMFEWVGQERQSIGEVCRRLKTAGTASPTGNPYWDHSTVWGMLRNPAYKGSAAYGKTKRGPWKARLLRPRRGGTQPPKSGRTTYDVPSEQWIAIAVPPIIDEGLFSTVEDQLAENRKRHRARKQGAKYLLQGLLVCKKCGYSFYGKPISRATAKGKKRYAYYRCLGTDAYRFGGRRICDNKQVRTDTIDDAVWQDVCNLLLEPRRIEQEYDRRLSETKKGSGWQSVDQLQKLINKMKRGICRLIDAYGEGLIDKSEFEPRIREAKARLVKLEEKATEQTDEETQYNELKLVIGHLEQFANRMTESLEECDWPTRRQIIRTLVKHVEVGHEEVKIVYRVDPAPFAKTPDEAVLQHCGRRDGAAPLGLRNTLRNNTEVSRCFLWRKQIGNGVPLLVRELMPNHSESFR